LGRRSERKGLTVLISDKAAPGYAALRPLKPTRTATFPVYHDLVDKLVHASVHPDDTVAHVMATCAGYAYSTADTVAMIMARMGLEDNRCRMIAEYVDAMFICSTSFVVQSRDGRVVLLAYRGTEPANGINWLTDADVHPDKVAIAFAGTNGSYAVHEGFYRNIRATRYEVVSALLRAVEGKAVSGEENQAVAPMEALYITGHSLGAAMAALIAVMLVTDPAYAQIAEKLRAVYSFGQPMIGSPELARACDADAFLSRNVIRYTYRRDVVAHLPPKASGPFAHFGPEYHYDGSWPWRLQAQPSEQIGNLLELAEAPLAFVSRQLRWTRKIPFHYSLDDHAPQHYVSRLTPPGTPSEFGDDVLAD
jgi:hypothetical protein